MNVLPPSTNTAEFGLQNKNSAADRISSLKASQQAITSNKASLNNTNNDTKADFGLQDRSTIAERGQIFESVKTKLIQNHGFEAKMATQDALTNNKKIINTPVLERGSLLDFRI